MRQILTEKYEYRFSGQNPENLPCTPESFFPLFLRHAPTSELEYTLVLSVVIEGLLNASEVSAYCNSHDTLPEGLLGMFGLTVRPTNEKERFLHLVQRIPVVLHPNVDYPFLMAYESSYETKERYPLLVNEIKKTYIKTHTDISALTLVNILEHTDEELYEYRRTIIDLLRTCVMSLKETPSKLLTFAILKAIRLNLLDSALYLPFCMYQSSHDEDFASRTLDILIRKEIEGNIYFMPPKGK
ncbi:MAG: hypothetical protein M0P35_04485 [Bacteroidales bacterium]|jgi:hypothetical protein|nr:hypothetical protein [Bacteroidales bacterium]